MASTVVSPTLQNVQKPSTTELLFARAKDMGLRPEWVVPEGLMAVTANEREQYINFARSPFNSDLAASLAKNKYLTRLILRRHDMPNIPFAQPQTLAEAKAFLSLHGTVIAKPVTGYGACDVHIITEALQLDNLIISDYILEKYIVGKELRYLVLDGEVIAVHESQYGTSVAADRPLKRISYPKSAWDKQLIADSLLIANILGLHFAAVDFLVDPDGVHHVLEVNTMPGLKWFYSPSEGPSVDVARLLLEAAYNPGPRNTATRFVS